MPSDYERVAATIHYLESHFREQPRLEDLAANLDLTPHHFQRLFRRWAGISPKRFLQYVTADFAKERLRSSRPVLDVSLDCGLSGPGRLHDLMLTLEGVTPGEVKAAGEGIEIGYGFHSSPFGECLLAATPRGVCALRFIEAGDRQAAVQEVRDRWTRATVKEDRVRTGELFRSVFNPGNGRGGAYPLHVMGTNFQIRVWEALLQIPQGQLVSYDDIARQVGNPTASRAVGSAVGANRVAWIIPCHRVLRKNAAIGGYRWGTDRKRAMIAYEAATLAGCGHWQ